MNDLSAVLHGAALAFATGDLLVSGLAWRTPSRSIPHVLGAAIMAIAMADSGVFGASLLPPIAWASVLVFAAVGLSAGVRMRTAAQGQARTVSVGRVLELPLGLIAMATITVMEGMAGGHGSTGHHSATGVSALAAVLLVVVSVIAASVIVDWRRNQGGRHSAAARGCMFCALGSMLVSVAL